MEVSANYERTFVVAAPAARTWEAFVDEKEREAWKGTSPSDMFEHVEVQIGPAERQQRLT